MQPIFGIDPTEIWDDSAGDVPGFSVGTLGIDDDGKIYQFARANGAISAVGDVVIIDESGDAAPVTDTLSAAGTGQGLPCGVALATMADNDWGWFQRHGPVGAVNCATSCAAHTELNTTSTAGRLDDNASGAEVVEGITLTAAESSNTATGILSWPYVGRVLA